MQEFFDQVAFIIGNLLGMFLKNKTGFVNKWIPYAVMACQLVIRTAQQLLESANAGAPPVDGAVLGSGFLFAAMFGAFWGGLWEVTKTALFDTIKAVALHTILKNTGEGVAKK